MSLSRYGWLIVLTIGMVASVSIYTYVDHHQQQKLQTEINYRSQIKQQAIQLWIAQHLDAAQTLVAFLDAEIDGGVEIGKSEVTALARGVMQVHRHDFVDLELRWGEVAGAVVRIDSDGRPLSTLIAPVRVASARSALSHDALSAPGAARLQVIQDRKANNLLRYVMAGQRPGVEVAADLNIHYLLESAINTGSAAGLDVDVSAIMTGKTYLLHHHPSRSRSADAATDANSANALQWRSRFQAGGLTLLVQTWPAPALLRIRSSESLWWLAASLMITLLLSSLSFNRYRFGERLQRQVLLRTAQLHAEQQKLEAVVNHASESILLVDDQGRILLANPAASALFGYAPEEWNNVKVNDLVPDASSAAHARWLQSEISGERHDIIGKSRDVHGRCKDGSTFPCEVTVNEFVTRDQRRFSIVLRDLSAVKQAEAAEKKRTDKRRAIAEILAASLHAQRLEDALQSALKIILDIEGLSLESRGSIFLTDVDAELRMSVQQNMSAAVCESCSRVAFGHCLCGQAAARNQMIVKSHLDDDHVTRTPHMSDHGHICAPIHSGDKILGVLNLYTKAGFQETVEDQEFIATASDAIAHIIENGLSAIKNERMLSIIETSPDFVGMADAEGCVLYVNPAGLEMLGLLPQSDMHRNMISDFHSPDELARMQLEIFPAIQSYEGQYTTEVRFLHQNGEEILTRASFSMQKDGDGEPASYSVIAHDIRHERETQKQMEHTQRLESLGVLAGGIAHDFNNILAAIMGNAALAERKSLTEPEQVRRYMHNIVESSEQAAALCNQMLAYSGKGRFIVEPVDLSKIVEDVTKLLEVSIARNVVVTYDLSDQLPAVKADAAQMQQVVMNLVINASDAIAERSGIITISTGLLYADHNYLRQSCIQEDIPEGNYVFMEVSDNGCGMDAATRERIFEPFFTTKFTGRGLGMSAILGIIRSHHGALILYSEVGEGTTFKVLLPALEVALVQDEDMQSDASLVKASGTILIIDDDESIRDMASTILQDAGYDTLTALNGLEGVELYRLHQHEVSVVLMDMTMPKLDGEACFRELRTINKDVKVLLCSGYSELDATSHFSGKGLVGFIQKPYLPDALIAVVQQAGM